MTSRDGPPVVVGDALLDVDIEGTAGPVALLERPLDEPPGGAGPRDHKRSSRR